jgi:hypothetical protein
MNQAGKDWDDTAEDEAAEAPDPWFRPVWEDLEDETDCTPPPRFPSQPWTSRSAGGAEAALLGPLAMAQDALARLDAMAELLSPALRGGLVARLAYAEAAGLLASRGGFAHPLDLALRDAERIGRRDLMARGRPAGEAPPAEGGNGLNPAEAGTWLDLDEKIGGALQLARLLQRLPALASPPSFAWRNLSPAADDPLATAAAARTRLGPLDRGVAAPFDADRFARWRAAHWPDGRRRGDEQPALLRAAAAAAAWMESGIADRPDAAQALAVAGMLLRRTGTLKTIPLTIWAGWEALCAAGDPGLLPRLRGDVAARLAGSSWPAVFLHLVAEAARAGSRTLGALLRAEAAGAALAAGEDRRSRLPAALALLLRHPALTAPALAALLAITPQAALRILTRIAAAGVAAEVTGRKSFRAFGILCG